MSSPEILSPTSTPLADDTMSPRPVPSSASSPLASPRPSSKLTSTHIQTMLRTKPSEYVVVENTGKHTSNCWSSFGFPALVDHRGVPNKIDGFVSCRKCLSTYSFASNSTRYLNRHDCNASPLRYAQADENKGSSAQRCLASFYPTKATTLKPAEATKIKDLQARWVSQNIRPFSVVEDEGLRHLVQECIAIGE